MRRAASFRSKGRMREDHDSRFLLLECLSLIHIYKRIVRKRIDSEKVELYLVALGYNLRKYITKLMRIRIAA